MGPQAKDSPLDTFYIVAAQPSDLPQLNSLLQASKSHWGYDAAFMKTFMQHLSVRTEDFQTCTLMLFKKEEEVLGFYGFRPEEEHLELSHFYLHPGFIGQGYGRHMWQACLETARLIKATEFLVWSDPHADSFYEKMGAKLSFFQRSSLAESRHQAVFRVTL